MGQDVSCTCPRCSQSLTVDAVLVGTSVECPSCGHELIVPSYTEPDDSHTGSIVISVARRGKEIGTFNLSQFWNQVNSGVIKLDDHIFIKSNSWLLLSDFNRSFPVNGATEIDGNYLVNSSVVNSHYGNSSNFEDNLVSGVQRGVQRELRHEIIESLSNDTNAPIGVDTDGDGDIDVVGIDTDGDGDIDVVGVDTDGDGDIDEFEGVDEEDDDEGGGLFSLFDDD